MKKSGIIPENYVVPTNREVPSDLARFHTHLTILRASRTAARDSIFRLLARYGPISTRDLVMHSNGSVSQSVVYENLRLFERIGVTQILHSGLHELSDRFKQHHHFLICRECSRSIAFYDRQLESALERFRKRGHFAVEDHNVEFSGICAQCQISGDVRPRAAIGGSVSRPPGLR